MFHNSHFKMISGVFPSTWQHGIPGNKIKPIFPFCDLMWYLEIICLLFTPSAKHRVIIWKDRCYLLPKIVFKSIYIFFFLFLICETFLQVFFIMSPLMHWLMLCTGVLIAVPVQYVKSFLLCITLLVFFVYAPTFLQF